MKRYLGKMKQRSIFNLALLLVTMLSLFPNIALASNIRVCASGCDSTTIQGGINLANSGDTIRVAGGIYNENIY